MSSPSLPSLSSLDIIKTFFVNEYSVEFEIVSESKLRDDLWMDPLGLEELSTHIEKYFNGVKITPIQWDSIITIGDVENVIIQQQQDKKKKITFGPIPSVNDDIVKLILTPVIDRQKSARQLEANAMPMISFYHAGGAVAQMRPIAKQIDDASGTLAVNPIWLELPGRGVRGKEPLKESAYDTALEFAATVATHVLRGDRSKPFLVFGHSCGTLHAFEVTRELQKMGFVPRALIVINRQAPQIPMDKPEDVFPSDPEPFVDKMAKEYGQKTLQEMWKTSREVVMRSLPPSINDMKVLTGYRIRNPEEKLQCPIICATATNDRASNCEANCRPWKDVSSHESFAFKLFSGGHFVYQDDSKTFWSWVFQNVK